MSEVLDRDAGSSRLLSSLHWWMFVREECEAPVLQERQEIVLFSVHVGHKPQLTKNVLNESCLLSIGAIIVIGRYSNYCQSQEAYGSLEDHVDASGEGIVEDVHARISRYIGSHQD